MYVESVKSKQANRTYKSILVRESYREDGKVTIEQLLILQNSLMSILGK